MPNEVRHTKTSEPLAAYWSAEDLPAMPRFLHELIAQATSKLQVSKIVIFGSRARADCHPMSDYDVAFMLDDSRGWAAFVAEQQEEAKTLLPLDLVNFHGAPETLRQAILDSGVTLYEA